MAHEEIITVTYYKLDSDAPEKEHIATFDDAEDARLFWDTIYYLHRGYAPSSARPKP